MGDTFAIKTEYNEDDYSPNVMKNAQTTDGMSHRRA